MTQIQIDRVTPRRDLGDVRLEHDPRRSPVLAWAVFGSLYFFAFGPSNLVALQVFAGSVSGQGTTASPATLEGMGFGLIWKTVFVVLGIAALLWYAPPRRRRDAVAHPWRRLSVALKVVPMATVACAAGWMAVDVLAHALGTNRLPAQDLSAAPILLAVVSMAMAGPVEELLIVALPALAMRTAGIRWSLVFLVSIVMRIPFHLYYGVPAIGLALWAGLIMALYKRTGSVLGLILAHALWNVLTFAEGDVFEIVLWVMLAAFVLVARSTLLRAQPKRAEQLN